MQLAGKTAFLTGAATGIGRAVARAFAREGARLVVTDVNAAELATTEALVREAGAEVLALACDVTDPASVAAAIAATLDRFGALDCVNNNAGMFGATANLLKTEEATARRLMEVNYWGTFHCLRAQIPVMLERGGGTIVNTASTLGLYPGPYSAAYSAAKHALVGLTGSVAREYAAKGIRINSVCPGFIETPMTQPLIEQAGGIDKAKPGNAIARFGSSEELAEAVLWLASPASRYVYAVNLPVDGASNRR